MNSNRPDCSAERDVQHADVPLDSGELAAIARFGASTDDLKGTHDE